MQGATERRDELGDNRRETRWDGGREKGRQGKLVRRKTKRDRDEDRHRRKERQRNLETLKQTGRQLRCLWRLEWS